MKLKKSLFRMLGVNRLNRRQQRLLETFEFLVRLLLFSIPLYLIIGLSVSLMPMQSAVASESAWVLETIGFRVHYDGVFITSYSSSNAEPFNFIINEDCAGWKSMLFLFALIFAVPGIALRKRLWGLVFGLPAIWTGNIARVVGVVLAEQAYGAEVALVVHDYLWQAGLIVLVLGIWLIWMWLARPKKMTLFKRIREAIRWRQ